jgi:putative transcriptional regulator
MRQLPADQPESFAGSLLVAHPSMLDPNFRRTVLFLSAHSAADGALGIILNRPLGKRVSDLVEQAPAAGLEKVPVFFGGPVQRDRLMFAAIDWDNGMTLNHNVGIEEANERLETDPGSIRAFVGYAGWNAGQLEAEMKTNSWLVQKPTRSAMKVEQLPQLWFDIMRGLGPWFKMLAAAPDDPSLN